MDADKNYCYKTENVNSNTLEQWQGLTAFLFWHSCLLRSTALSCMGFVSTHVACNHLATPFPRKLLPVPELKQSRGCDNRRVKTRNNMHHVPDLMSEGIILGAVVFNSCSCVELFESFENCSENCHHQEMSTSKNFTMSPAQQPGAASQNCGHTDIYECLDSIRTGMLCIPKIPVGDAFSVVPESCPASSHILFSAFLLCIIISDLPSLLLRVYAQHPKWVDSHYICQLF